MDLVYLDVSAYPRLGTLSRAFLQCILFLDFAVFKDAIIFYNQLIFASKAVLTPVIKVVKNLSIGKIFKIMYSSILNIGLLPPVLIVL